MRMNNSIYLSGSRESIETAASWSPRLRSALPTITAVLSGSSSLRIVAAVEEGGVAAAHSAVDEFSMASDCDRMATWNRRAANSQVKFCVIDFIDSESQSWPCSCPMLSVTSLKKINEIMTE